MKQHRIFILIALFAAALLNGAEIQKNSFAVVFDAGLTVDDAMTASKKGKLPGTPQTFVMPEIKTFNLKNLRPDYTPIKDAALLSFVINADEAEEIVLGVGVDYWHTLFQNGKLIGAITHVLINNPTEGYGIFIENMLPEAEAAEENAA